MKLAYKDKTNNDNAYIWNGDWPAAMGHSCQNISSDYRLSRDFGYDSCEIFLLLAFVYISKQIQLHASAAVLLTVGHKADTMYFTTLESPVDIDANVGLNDFYLTDSIMRDCSMNYTSGWHQITPCLTH